MFIRKFESKLLCRISFIDNNALYLVITQVNIHKKQRSLLLFLSIEQLSLFFLMLLKSRGKLWRIWLVLGRRTCQILINSIWSVVGYITHVLNYFSCKCRIVLSRLGPYLWYSISLWRCIAVFDKFSSGLEVFNLFLPFPCLLHPLDRFLSPF
jgi:hypothetical protein